MHGGVAETLWALAAESLDGLVCRAGVQELSSARWWADWWRNENALSCGGALMCTLVRCDRGQ